MEDEGGVWQHKEELPMILARRKPGCLIRFRLTDSGLCDVSELSQEDVCGSNRKSCRHEVAYYVHIY